MALPDNWSTVTVTGTFIDINGDPMSGTVSFTSSKRVQNTSASVVVPASTVTETLDENGSFSVVLPATDDADVSASFTYLVEERVIGPYEEERNANYHIALPSSPSSVDLSAVTPVEAA